MSDTERPNLLGADPRQFAEVAASIGAPGYTAAQLSEWIYHRKRLSFGDMTNIARRFRDVLESGYELSPLEIAEVHTSGDGTRKYVFRIRGEHYIESALIPDDDRLTLCLSTQIGCRRKCRFCYTGAMGYHADLRIHELLGQFASIPEVDDVTNIVYMGMGEPLDAIDLTMRSLEAFTGTWGYGMSPRRITVSTVGIIPGLERFLSGSSANLAISVHAADSAKRRTVMPVEARYPIAEVMRTVREHQAVGRRKVSIEYVVFKDFNDGKKDIDSLARLLNGVRCRINLIPFNSDLEFARGNGLMPATPEAIDRFRIALLEKGFRVTVRKSRGNDIAAACGRLTTRRFYDGQRDQES